MSNESGVISREDPPETTRRGRGKFSPQEVFDALSKAEDDEWYVIPATEGVTASYGHSSGLAKRLRELGAETKMARKGDAYALYARLANKRDEVTKAA